MLFNNYILGGVQLNCGPSLAFEHALHPSKGHAVILIRIDCLRSIPNFLVVIFVGLVTIDPPTIDPL